MRDDGQHCPFLDQSDPRCSAHLRLVSLPQAFEHCLGRYKSCPVYFYLRVEARIDQARSAVLRRSPDHATQTSG